MSEYVDTKLINCNRLASTESRSGNDSNPAVFTNPLNETIKLDVGDKVSLERAFISEVGAGNPSTIEFKGVSRGSNPVATYTDIQYEDYYYKKSNTYDPKYRLGYYRSITTTEVTDDTVDLRDNLAPLVIGYFITSNEYPNYIQHPRRFTTDLGRRGNTNRNNAEAYSNKDSIAEGLPLGEFTINTDCPCLADYRKRESLSNTEYFKQRIDNTRYTLFIKDKIAYSVGATHDKDQFPKNSHNGIFSEAKYYRVREKINIEVNKGFNTPSAVANQITQQLTETKNETIFEILDQDNFIHPLTKTIETNTFKPINAQNQYNFNDEAYDGYVAQNLAPHAAPTQIAVDYIATFGYIGVKRPEIFETGRNMHYKINNTPNQPTIYDSGGHPIAFSLEADEGFETIGNRPVLAAQTTNEDTFFTLNILYNETTLGLIRDLFDAEALYPELWDNLEDTIAYSEAAVDTLDRPSIDNSRFLHMNKYSANLGASPNNDTFGDDAFTQRPSPNNLEMSTQPVFFKYDDTKRDYYVPPEQYRSIAVNGLVYGFAYPVKITQHDAVTGANPRTIYLVGITNGGVGGTPRKLFSEDTVDDDYKSIKARRRIGFDFHASAYSTAIITPFSGYFNTDISVAATQNEGKNDTDIIYLYPTQINHIRSAKTSTNMTDFNPYMTMSYIGANNPAINYNTTTNRFELSRFHTGNNTGNKATASNPSSAVNSKSLCPPNRNTERLIEPATVNQEANTTVYKINPRPPQFGFSPTFKPYFRQNQAYRRQPYPETATEMIKNTSVNTLKYDGFNPNIEAYKIFDSHGGIYIEDWGFDEDNWEDNLWDILGFDYNAVNAKPTSKNVLTKRVDNENSSLLYRPTTNAEVVQTDTKNYVTNQFGAVMYYNQLPYPTCVPLYTATHTGANDEFFYVGGTAFTPANATPLELWNEVTVLTQSTTITATDIQKSVLRPYYTIRSNILEGATAIGGNPTGANLPIISVVDKYSAASDYFLGNPSDIQFTVTKPTVIADITTSIHDSDGEYANVDKTSAVIYKITKVRRTPPSIIEEILQDEAKEQKKKKK